MRTTLLRTQDGRRFFVHPVGRFLTLVEIVRERGAFAQPSNSALRPVREADTHECDMPPATAFRSLVRGRRHISISSPPRDFARARLVSFRTSSKGKNVAKSFGIEAVPAFYFLFARLCVMSF